MPTFSEISTTPEGFRAVPQVPRESVSLLWQSDFWDGPWSGMLIPYVANTRPSSNDSPGGRVPDADDPCDTLHLIRGAESFDPAEFHFDLGM